MSVDAELVEALVVDAEVMGELVDDRDPDLVREVIGVGEVLLEWQPKERDPVGDRRPVRPPLCPRDALVQAVEGLVRRDVVLTALVGRRFVGDDHGDLVERARERLRNRVEGAGDQLVERAVTAETMTGASRTAAALDHGARILGAMEPVPPPDPTAEPDGFVVVVEPGDRIHFLDWGGSGDPGQQGDPGDDGVPRLPGVLLIHGLSNTAWSWTPVARRLRLVRRVVAMDLRGHGLSDAPTEGYDPPTFAADVLAAAEGSGLLTSPDDRVILAGHGFGAIVAAWAAVDLGERCAGLVLVDGGWESLEAASGMDVEEFLRGLDEPPEVMRSMAAFLADRQAFDPATWDGDQDRAARATVVETHAGKVVPATRPHAAEASVRAMFDYDPLTTLPAVEAPIVALPAADDESGSRARSLAEASHARAAAGRPPIRAVSFGHDGHNLMRYRPEAVSAAILSVAVEPRG